MKKQRDKEKQKIYNAKYESENKERRKEINARYRANNIEKIKLMEESRKGTRNAQYKKYNDYNKELIKNKRDSLSTERKLQKKNIRLKLTKECCKNDNKATNKRQNITDSEIKIITEACDNGKYRYTARELVLITKRTYHGIRSIRHRNKEKV